MGSRLQDVIMRDTRANQPLATAVSAGTLYYVTDEGVTERSNGTTWQSFSDSGVVSPIIVSAGTLTGSRSSLVFSNSNGISFGLAGSTITASHNGLTNALTNIKISAGTTSNNLSSLVFSNSNNVSFGLNGSTVTASVTVASTAAIVNLSAGTTSNNLSVFVFSNSNNVSFGLNGSTVTATATVVSTQGSIKVSASGSSANLSALTFANSNSITFGLSDGIITASFSGGGGGGETTLSNYFNVPVFVTQGLGNAASNQIAIQPFILPQAISAAYIRFPVSIAPAQSAWGTSLGTTFSAAQFHTLAFVMYSKGTGLSSNSLMSILSSSIEFNWSIAGQHATNTGSHWSYTRTVTYPVLGSTSSFSHSLASTSANISFATSLVSNFANFRYFDIPFNGSLAPNMYWVGIGKSSVSSVSSFGGPNGLTWGISSIGASQASDGFSQMGSVLDERAHMGRIFWSTNSGMFSTANINLSDAGSVSAAGIIPFRIEKA